MSPEGEVRSASQRFYSALNRMLDGDAGPLAEIWSHDATVTIMHPIGGREVGWESVGGICPNLTMSEPISVPPPSGRAVAHIKLGGTR
jgi:hypothetical protein